MPRYYSAKLAAPDQVAPVSHTAVTALFETPDPEDAFRRLKEGIAELCRQLPWLAGFVFRADQGYSHLAWRDDGQVFLERLHMPGVPSFAQLSDTGCRLHELPFDFRPTGMTTREAEIASVGQTAPAMLVSCTTVEGGLIFTLATHHHICDGTQAIIYAMIAENVAGRPQSHHRDKLQPLMRYDHINKSLALDDPLRPKGNLHGELSEHDLPEDVQKLLLCQDGETRPAAVPSTDLNQGKRALKQEVITIPMANLHGIRAAIAGAAGLRKPPVVLLIIAIFWSLLTHVREQGGSTMRSTSQEDGTSEARTSVIFPVSARPTFAKTAGLDESNYIGNLISGGLTNVDCADLRISPAESHQLISQSLLTALQHVATAGTMAMNADWIRARLNVVLQLPDARVLVRPSGMGGNDLLVTSWAHLDLYPDFGPGMGRARFIRPGVAPQSRTNRDWYSYIIVLGPRFDATGTEVIEIFACFDADDMAALKRSPLLRSLQDVSPSTAYAKL